MWESRTGARLWHIGKHRLSVTQQGRQHDLGERRIRRALQDTDDGEPHWVPRALQDTEDGEQHWVPMLAENIDELLTTRSMRRQSSWFGSTWTFTPSPRRTRSSASGNSSSGRA